MSKNLKLSLVIMAGAVLVFLAELWAWALVGFSYEVGTAWFITALVVFLGGLAVWAES